MQKLFLQFFAQVQRSGLAITIMVIASFLFIREIASLQGKIDACTEMRITDMKTERVELLQVLNKVENALRENTRAIRKNTGE